jgi:transposase-like protein
MNQPIFTKEQIEGLLKNENVSRFCGKYIAYSKEFKIRAVDQYLNEGMSPREIFKQAGFDLQVFSRYKPGYLMYDWVKIYKARGVEGFATETRGRKGGRPKKVETLTDEEKIKRLELEVQYLKKENDFLVKLRAKRAE